MSDYYHQFLTSVSGIGNNPELGQQDPHLTHGAPSMSVGGAPIPNPYQSLGYFTGFPEPIMFNAPKAQRSRRKSAPGLDHIKHRRTRSGCYTCRSRRVKCDETHPICERCRKGKRECVYPDPPAPKSSSGSASKDASNPSQHTSPTSSHEDEQGEMDEDTKLDTIIDEEEDEPEIASQATSRAPSGLRRGSTTSSLSLRKLASGTRHSSETPSLEGTKSSSPSTGTTSSLTPATYQFHDFPHQVGTARADWSHLPPDFQFYLNYFCDNITHYHYCMVQDSDDFFRTILPSLALRNEALLYAVVGFAAYHHTLQNPNGKIHEFLQYYNRSVTLLLGFLTRKEKHNLGTLLTILQLATIEEYLGDWVNLMGHQKAAHEVLTQLFTPQSAMQTPMHRMILTWYVRFDVFVGLMGGFETTLPREWFTTTIAYYQSQLAADPENLHWKYEDCSSRLRLISMDMSMLFARGARGEIPQETFAQEHAKISKQLRDWKEIFDPELTNQAYLVTQSGGNVDPGNIVDPYALGILYDYPLFTTTVLTCEWHSIVIMHEFQALMSAQAEPTAQLAELSQRSFAICQIFDTIQSWPSTPKGTLIIIHPCIAIATLFLPRDEKHHMWIRRKFALLESMGYIFPLTMRTRMAELFRDQSCVQWWLPHDEGFTPILKAVRAFADERNATAVSAQTENLREIRHIFAKMELGGSEGSPADDLIGGAGGTLGKGKDIDN